MAVDFADYFWGEKHDGFQVLMHNLKASLLAAKELSEFVKETALIQEHNTKVYSKISKQLSSNVYFGTFSPILAALKASSDKLCQIHTSTLNKINDLLKDIMKYSEELHKKQKQIKDEESSTSDVVKCLQETSLSLGKQKEFYKTKVVELDKIKRETNNIKDIEKVESKVKRAQEEYRLLVDKYSTVLEDFEKKMASSCKNFQKAETCYLTQMMDFTHLFIESIDHSHNQVGKVNFEFEQHLVENSVEKMLETFVLQKHTGLVKPGPVEFNEAVSIKSGGGGPPSDISDRSANSDKLSVTSIPKKESTGCSVEAVLQSEDTEPDQQPPSVSASSSSASSSASASATPYQHHRQPPPPPLSASTTVITSVSSPTQVLSTSSKSNLTQVPSTSQAIADTTASTSSLPAMPAHMLQITTSTTTTAVGVQQETSRSPYASLANWSVPGFLKGRKKKESKKRKPKDEDENEAKEMGSDGEDRRRSETPTPETPIQQQVEDGGYSEPPAPAVATDPWADLQQQPVKKSFYSSSDSDSDDEIKKIKVKIRPVNSSTRSATSASVDELQKAITGIDLTMATLPTKGRSKSVMKEVMSSHTLKYKKRHTPTVDFDAGVKRSQSTNLVSKHSHDLLGLFNMQDTVASDVSGGIPGAESTRLDLSANSNSSKEVSSILHDIHDLNGAEELGPPTHAAPPPPTSLAAPSPTSPSMGETGVTVQQSQPATSPSLSSAAVSSSSSNQMASFTGSSNQRTLTDSATGAELSQQQSQQHCHLPTLQVEIAAGDTVVNSNSGVVQPMTSSGANTNSSSFTNWTDNAWKENSKKEEASWATNWADPVQPALPPKLSVGSHGTTRRGSASLTTTQPIAAVGSGSPDAATLTTGGASAKREKIANSIISLPRPPSRARPEPRLRGTPSPTPTSFLQTTALSLARSDSIGSTGSDRVVSRSDSFATKFSDPVKQKSDSLGSTRSESFSRSEDVRTARAGPLYPAPRSDSPRSGGGGHGGSARSSRGESPASSSSTAAGVLPPPSGPAPTLNLNMGGGGSSSGGHNSFASSRGPSPLTLGGAEVVPLAVAFQEVVHAAFRGRDESRCLVKQLGDMMLSFPAGIVGVLAANPYPAPLQFRINNASRLESVLPNKQLISKNSRASTQDTLVFEFNMHSLQELLNKQSQINPHASYFNIDILKYQITPLDGAASCPFQMVSYWKCEDDHTDLRLDFKYNQHAMSRPTPLLNLSLAVPVDGVVLNMTSQPKGAWNSETQRALWKFPDLSATQNNGVGAIRARFQLGRGPGTQGTIAAQFNCEGTTLSGVEFELIGQGYRVSLVKRRFVSGKYVSEPEHSADSNRYAAPPMSSTDY